MATEVAADSLGDEWKVSSYNLNRVYISSTLMFHVMQRGLTLDLSLDWSGSLLTSALKLRLYI